jgi:hypothetical protein
VGGKFLSEAVEIAFNHLKTLGHSPRLERVPQEMVKAFFADRARFRVEPTPDQSDYVYLTEDLIELKGNLYHRKKNHLNRFLREYPQAVYLPLTPERIPACLELQEDWCNLKNCLENPSLMREDQATYEILATFSRLPLKGGVVLLNKKVIAFTLGEALNPETLVIHIEKADPQYPGLYAFIHQKFLEHEGFRYRYTNREQDLGEEGLRKAKQSYYPHHMVEKYTIIGR